MRRAELLSEKSERDTTYKKLYRISFARAPLELKAV